MKMLWSARSSTPVLLVALLAAGCPDPAPPAAEAQASRLPPIQVVASAKMLFTYFDPQARVFKTTSKIADVPAQHRGWVRVVDLRQKAAKRRDHELVYVADLRKPGKKKAFPYVVMSRAAFETAAQNGVRPGATAPARPTGKGATGVVLYSTSWCPACRKARQWLQQKGVHFVEKDIEKDSAAAAELMRKAQAAGIPASGVPVLDVKGTLVQGFDPQRISALLGEKR